MIIAVIPARGGSKRISRKNIRFFEGKPIIAWSIEAALATKCFDKVIVSTDDQEIATIARKYGAETPFVRPKELSDDLSGTAEVMRHAIKAVSHQSAKVSIQNGVIKSACCIYATAPFVCPKDIQAGLQILNDNSSDYALAVTRFEFPIQRALKLNYNNDLEMINPQFSLVRSQDLPQAFHDAGQFCWGTSEAWLCRKPIFNSNTVAVHIPRYRVQDIDNEDDWRQAELMFRASRI